MKIYETLQEKLKNEPGFVNENGELKKWIVINKAQNYDTGLIDLLLEDKDLKKKFFIETKKVLVFNQSLFIQFLEQKGYLNESYTAYKNRVGLSIDGEYLKQRKEVVLVWPFKDCILEGGLSREEEKKEKIFFNEILAVDEITRLLEPKVLTNVKRYNAKGQKPVGKFKRNKEGIIADNLIIKGNNLIAINTLKPAFGGKVNLIYIDPPYNTGSDSFNYNDSFNQSTWLTFMKNRIDSAKSLLAPQGIFLVQCSFHQFAYLKVMMNDLFEKHLCDFNIQVRHPDRALTGDKEYNDVIEYILIYSNDPNKKMPFREEVKTIDDYITKINITNNKKPATLQCDNKSVEIYLPDQYEVKTIPASREGLKKISIRGSIREKNSSGRFFVKHLEKLKNYPPLTLFKVPDMGDDASGHRYFYSAPSGKKNGGYYQGMPTSSEVTKKQYPNFFNFEKEYNNVSKQGGVEFRNGKKPEELLKFLVELFTKEGDVVLDYHLGSGTTAAVCHKINRQYIGLEQIQNQIDLSLTRLNNVIQGDKTGISSFPEVRWKGGGEFIYLELKKYNELFIERIEDSKNTKSLLNVLEELKTKSFLNYNIDLQKQKKHLEEFKTLPLAEKKRYLIELLDKNQLYVNLSSLNDKDFSCSETEKDIVKDFYQI